MAASDCPELALAKGRPRRLVKRERQAARKAQDQRESRKVKARSEGRCEMRELKLSGLWAGMASGRRCVRRASQVHHMKSGIGVRGRGLSALAAWKQHLCDKCHEDQRLHVLVPVDPTADAEHIVYRRIR